MTATQVCHTCGQHAAAYLAAHTGTGQQWPICVTCLAQARRHGVPIEVGELPEPEPPTPRPPGPPVHLLADLTLRDVRLGVVDGHLRTSSPPGAIDDAVAAEIGAQRDLLVWTVIGRDHGHVWAPCDRCGQAVLLDRHRTTGTGSHKRAGRPCVLTPGCPGWHRAPDHQEPAQ